MKIEFMELLTAAKRIDSRACDAAIDKHLCGLSIYSIETGWVVISWKMLCDALRYKCVEVGKVDFFDRTMMQERKQVPVLVLFK